MVCRTVVPTYTAVVAFNTYLLYFYVITDTDQCFKQQIPQ